MGVRAFLPLLLALALWPGRADSAEPSITRKALILGIDGLRTDALVAATTPHLDGLAGDGTLARNTQIVWRRTPFSKTDSAVGWTSILTGVWADKHGVTENAARSTHLASYPHFFYRLGGESWAAASGVERRRFATASITAGKRLQRFLPIAADVSLAVNPAPDDPGLLAADETVASEAARLLAGNGPDVTFLLFGSVDRAGHDYGFDPAVPEYRRSIENLDRLAGDVLAAIRRRPTYAREDWLVIVCTDHGGRGIAHSDGYDVPEIRTVFLIVSGPSAQRGELTEPTFIVDVAPTVLAHLGVPVAEEWGWDGRAVGLAALAPRPPREGFGEAQLEQLRRQRDWRRLYLRTIQSKRFWLGFVAGAATLLMGLAGFRRLRARSRS